MKKAFLILSVLLTISANAQVGHVCLFYDSTSASVSWQLYRYPSMILAASGQGPADGQMLHAAPPVSFTYTSGELFQMVYTDPECTNGYHYGYVVIDAAGYGVQLVGSQIGAPMPWPYGCTHTRVFGMYTTVPCWQNCPIQCPGDLNGDGLVGSADLLIFQQLFGTTCNPLKK